MSQWMKTTSQLPTHSDGVRVILIDESGLATHGLASRPERPQDCDVPLVDGWRLWYYTPGLTGCRVEWWAELEPLELFHKSATPPKGHYSQ